ncbi:MAG: serine hydrolase [bacterium]|nr:serine hydrolase [bacterium]
MILLNSGAESKNTPNIQQLRKKNGLFKLVKTFALLFLFALLFGTTFWSVQWFANSVQGFFFMDGKAGNNVFSGSLETSAISIIEPHVEIEPEALPALVELTGGDTAEEIPSPAALVAPVISPKSAISLKIQEGSEAVLFGKNENEVLPVASLTKLMTALIVLEQYDLAHQVVIGEGAMKQEGPQGELKLGQTLSVKDLLYITLIESSNKSAYALASVMGNYKFVDVMNERARQLGLSQTYFIDSTGLRPGSRSTAADIANLSRHLFENYPLFKEIISLKEFDLYLSDGTLHHNLVSTNKLLRKVPSVIGGKTGWTNEAKGCFMVVEAQADGGYIIHVVLGSDNRFSDMEKLLAIK